MRVIVFEDRFPDDVFVFSETKVELVGVLFCLVRARERRKNISVKNTFEIIRREKNARKTPSRLTLVQLLSSNLIVLKSTPPQTSARLPHACPFNLTPSVDVVNLTSKSPFFSELFVGMRMNISTSVVLCCQRTRSFLGSSARYFCFSALVIRERSSSEEESNAILISSFLFVASSEASDDVDIFICGVFPTCAYFYPHSFSRAERSKRARKKTKTRTRSREMGRDDDGSNEDATETFFPSVPGLRYIPNLLDAETHDVLVQFIHSQLALGRSGKLEKKATYTPIPPKWDKRLQGREMLQYGTYTHSNRVYTDHEVEVEPMPEILRELVVERLVERGVFGEEKNEEDARKNLSSGGGGVGGGANDTSRRRFLPDSCTVNVYRKGQWLPPHVDNPNFKRPFCTVSLLADEMCIFGRGIVWHPGLDESSTSGSGSSNSSSNSAVLPEESWYDMTNALDGEECRVVCEKNSAIILDGESGDVYEHAILPVRAEDGRISLTFRKRDWDEDAVNKRTEETEKWRAEYREKRKTAYEATKEEVVRVETERARIARERLERKKAKEARKLETLARKQRELEIVEERRKEKEEKKKTKEPKSKTHKECLPVPEGLLKNDGDDNNDKKKNDDNDDDKNISDVNRMPEVEREYVQKVYDVVAKQWHGTRYRSWPAIEKFVANQPKNGFVADIGCGNGKNMHDVVKGGGTVIGMDFSHGLIEICAEQGFEVQVADALMVPYRSRVFDYALNIAVLHHISSEERRIRMCEETLRVVKVGGVALFCAWAYEQDKGGVSGHDFLAQDVLVPFHKRPIAKGMRPAEQKELDDAMVREGKAPSHGEINQEKHTVVYQRYCHVYKEGELEKLFEKIPGCKVEAAYFDFGNWCVEVRVTRELK